MKRFSQWLAVLGVLGIVAVAVALRVGGDRWWPVFPVLFGPRWIWIPVLFLIVPSLRWQPGRSLALLAVASLVLLYGVMGFRIGLARFSTPSATALHLRVLQFNVSTSHPAIVRILDSLDAWHVDVALVESCPSLDGPTVQAHPGWQMHAAGQLCIYSRWPITSWTPRSQDDIWQIRGKAAIGDAVVAVAGVPIHFALLHLKSPRDALTEFFDLSTIPTLGPAVTDNSRVRRIESGLALTFVTAPPGDPAIVAGDFNLPIESTIFRHDWSSYSDAWERAGLGFGYTFLTRRHGVRIDHILYTGGLSATRTWLGPDLGSDHLPLIADLTLPLPQRTSTAR